MSEIFDEKDLSIFANREITRQEVENQILKFEKGFPFMKLIAPATLADGISDIASKKDELITQYDQSELSSLKFVPASGAASRMFKKLFEFREESKDEGISEKILNEKGPIYYFFSNLDSFAFYEDLKASFLEIKKHSLEEAKKNQDFAEILEVFLAKPGLNYGKLPKGLLKFHKYDSTVKTPTQEHITEGLQYLNTKKSINIHFTVSPEHQALFESHINDSIKNVSVEMDITFSTQKPSTDTVAVDMENNPFRLENDELLFRPAGHGALLENLNDLNSDIIFIKNIDNVVPDRIRNETIEYKKALAGLLVNYQRKTFGLLEKHDAGESIEKEGRSLLQEMGVKGDFTLKTILEKLDRPIRVCGMVKNEGEPGGGPFWVSGDDHTISLQIVESAQVDMNDSTQADIFKKSTHFNPVDLVCGIKNYKGEKFNLLKYRDAETGFISEKSNGGQKLKAMELPGLWNGSMADWNTVFVEVPLITFNPVKTVNDLLKENHH